MSHLKPLLLLIPLVVMAGCGDDPKPPPKTGGDAIKDGPKGAKADMASPTSGSIQIDSKILKLCGDLPVAHFAFDSTAIKGEAASALEPLAKCFISGPAKGKGMRLIGHTDSRGETGYNQALGQRRSGSIADFLATKGVTKAKLETSSAGELEATGTDEEGWAKDRKVVILLVE